MNILYLPLNKEPFDIMITGEKSNEYRKPSFWIKSRLFNKDGTSKNIDYIKFTQGYGSDRPYFIAKFEGFKRAKINYSMKYSNGLKVIINKADFNIKVGMIVEYGNIYAPGEQLRLISHLSLKL